jgi:acetyl-CoA acetyltransferase
MRKVVIIGVGMTQFGKFLDTGIEELGRTAVWNAIKDANINPKDIQVAYVANAAYGLIYQKVGTLGQVVLARCGLGGIPIINVENACAGGSTALRGAYLEVASGNYDVAMAVGVEKMYCADVAKSIAAMASNSPYDGMGYQFTSEYAMFLRRYMKEYNVTKEQFAKVVEKNSYSGSLNPYAQHRRPLSVEEVLKSRLIAEPLTLYMCSSIGDGGAAAIVCSGDVARRYTSKPLVEIAALGLRSGVYRKQNKADPDIDISTLTANEAYESAGIEPEDIDVAEVHDAMAPAELLLYEYLGFCKPGEGARLIDEGRTKITGRPAVNPSGGLAAKGHPIAATGLAQAAEIVWQLRGEAGERQTQNPKVGLTENAGGYTEFDDSGACTVTILKR